MNYLLSEWAIAHGISQAAVQDLVNRIRAGMMPESNPMPGKSEAAVTQQVRFQAANQGVTLWRNNVGVAEDSSGNVFRYGLCNDSKKINERFKSSDLIGFRPLMIQPSMVNRVIAQFVAVECKSGDWKFKGTDREKAQQNFLDVVTGGGGVGAFSTGNIDHVVTVI